MKTLQSVKLTKKFFMGLPEGVFLISNLVQTLNSSKFEEYVTPVAEREKQWQKIVSLECNNRLCHVFENKTQAKEWIENPDLNPPC